MIVSQFWQRLHRKPVNICIFFALRKGRLSRRNEGEVGDSNRMRRWVPAHITKGVQLFKIEVLDPSFFIEFAMCSRLKGLPDLDQATRKGPFARERATFDLHK